MAECIAVERKTRLQAIPFQYVESRFGRTRESELAEKGGGGRGQTNLQVDQPKPPCSHGDPAEIHSPGLAAKLDKFPYTGVYLNTENHS